LLFVAGMHYFFVIKYLKLNALSLILAFSFLQMSLVEYIVFNKEYRFIFITVSLS